jgi:hypothetical protein
MIQGKVLIIAQQQQVLISGELINLTLTMLIMVMTIAEDSLEDLISHEQGLNNILNQHFTKINLLIYYASSF